MTPERDLLRDIWARTDAEAPPATGHAKTCKAMRHVGFGTEAEPVDDDLRAAWRAKLAREGKLGESTVADLIAER